MRILAGAGTGRRGTCPYDDIDLAAYAGLSPSFGDVYGPLAGIVALLLWTLLSSIALFLGAAVCAQLEACRGGQPDPAHEDPGRPHGVRVSDRGEPAQRG